jgi:cholesterol oxidase
MANSYDIIVIGSGFGGAVVACRSAQSGARVLILERGQRWNPDNYPRGLGDPWLYDNRRPHRKHGWLELRHFRRMIVAQGAGVGGGSLCYSSVVLQPPAHLFDRGWPAEIAYGDLLPHFETVSRMLGVRTIPTRQRSRRNLLLREAAEKLNWANRLFNTPLAVAFDDHPDQDSIFPWDKQQTRAVRNAHGRWQGTCIHAGNCDIGCDVQAKNTLDLNYLAEAERAGAEIRSLHLVRCIEPGTGGGYRVHFDRIERSRLSRESVVAPRVVLSAGSLGSSELLLRCRDEFRTLPKLSPRLGMGWSPNGNVLTPAIYPSGDRVMQSVGLTISAGLDFSDGTVDDQQFVIEDDGFPNLLRNALRQAADRGWLSALSWSLSGYARSRVSQANPLSHVMVWLGAGLDAGEGRLDLRRKWLTPWRTSLGLNWNPEQARRVVEAALRIQGELTHATGGRLKVPLIWRWLRTMVTVHPLGGCGMGDSIDRGVVNHAGEVFGYPGLFVVDGAMVPKPIGRNPSLTIAGLAERSSRFITAASSSLQAQ